MTVVIQPVPEVLDVTPPVVTITSPGNGDVDELNQVVLADYACTDAGSGIGTCVGDVANGAAIGTSTLGPHTLTVTGTDAVGNVASPAHSYTVIDTTPPVVTITPPADGAVLENGFPVLAAYGCTDAGFGIATCVGDVAVGAAIDTAAEGVKTFMVTGTDLEGNFAVAVSTYTVVDTIAENAAVFESALTATVDATSITIDNPTGTEPDDLLIASVVHSVHATITPLGGWTTIDVGQCTPMAPPRVARWVSGTRCRVAASHLRTLSCSQISSNWLRARLTWLPAESNATRAQTPATPSTDGESAAELPVSPRRRMSPQRSLTRGSYASLAWMTTIGHLSLTRSTI